MDGGFVGRESQDDIEREGMTGHIGGTSYVRSWAVAQAHVTQTLEEGRSVLFRAEVQRATARLLFCRVPVDGGRWCVLLQ